MTKTATRKTKKKAGAIDAGEVPGVAGARKTTKKNPDLAEVFEETKEKDDQDARLGKAASSVKDCHLVIQELNKDMIVARSETTPVWLVKQVLERVAEGATEIQEHVADAQRALVL